MLSVNSKSKASGTPLPEPLDSKDAEAVPVPVPLPLIISIGKQRLALEQDLRSATAKRKVLNSLKDLVLVRSGGIDAVPAMHPVNDLNVQDKAVSKALEEIEQLDGKLAGNAIFKQEAAEEQELFEGLKELAVERASLQVC